MENSINNNKYKDQRPGVIEEKSSKIDSGENEKVRAVSDGPFKGVQAARGLAPAAGGITEAASQCRMLITKEASHSLDDMAARVGAGFEGGRISRPQIVSWVLQRFAERMTATDVEDIRAAFFDKIAYLEALLKRAKETGIAPAELDAICPGTGGTIVARRKYKRRTDAA